MGPLMIIDNFKFHFFFLKSDGFLWIVHNWIRARDIRFLLTITVSCCYRRCDVMYCMYVGYCKLCISLFNDKTLNFWKFTKKKMVKCCCIYAVKIRGSCCIGTDTVWSKCPYIFASSEEIAVDLHLHLYNIIITFDDLLVFSSVFHLFPLRQNIVVLKSKQSFTCRHTSLLLVINAVSWATVSGTASSRKNTF